MRYLDAKIFANHQDVRTVMLKAAAFTDFGYAPNKATAGAPPAFPAGGNPLGFKSPKAGVPSPNIKSPSGISKMPRSLPGGGTLTSGARPGAVSLQMPERAANDNLRPRKMAMVLAGVPREKIAIAPLLGLGFKALGLGLSAYQGYKGYQNARKRGHGVGSSMWRGLVGNNAADNWNKGNYGAAIGDGALNVLGALPVLGAAGVGARSIAGAVRGGVAGQRLAKGLGFGQRMTAGMRGMGHGFQGGLSGNQAYKAGDRFRRMADQLDARRELYSRAGQMRQIGTNPAGRGGRFSAQQTNDLRRLHSGNSNMASLAELRQQAGFTGNNNRFNRLLGRLTGSQRYRAAGESAEQAYGTARDAGMMARQSLKPRSKGLTSQRRVPGRTTTARNPLRNPENVVETGSGRGALLSPSNAHSKFGPGTAGQTVPRSQVLNDARDAARAAAQRNTATRGSAGPSGQIRDPQAANEAFRRLPNDRGRLADVRRSQEGIENAVVRQRGLNAVTRGREGYSRQQAADMFAGKAKPGDTYELAGAAFKRDEQGRLMFKSTAESGLGAWGANMLGGDKARKGEWVTVPPAAEQAVQGAAQWFASRGAAQQGMWAPGNRLGTATNVAMLGSMAYPMLQRGGAQTAAAGMMPGMMPGMMAAAPGYMPNYGGWQPTSVM